MAVLPAAAIGAAAGALTGALTTPEQVNLGTPAWKHGVQSAAPPAAAPAASVTEIQTRLANLGYEPGPIDGLCGPRTRAAIRHYQQDRGLTADGVPSVALVESLRQADS
jgi:peptidoglycan hydrolase-like protein with peptidoglycan-binding domain